MSNHQISICLCPTVSLMQDQVVSLTEKGITVVRLGSDHTLADYNAVFNSPPGDRPKIVYMTPEYLFGASEESSGCLEKMRKMEEDGKLAYIAIDEAHYIWQRGGSFRKNYSQLKTLKNLFQKTPIAALTATATPAILDELKDMLRSPFVVRGSVNRPNVYVSIERGHGFGETLNKGKKTSKTIVSESDRFTPTAKRIKEKIGQNCAIVYASFAEDCRKLTKTLKEMGIKAEYYVGSSGSMTSKEKEAVHKAFKEKSLQVICGTEAFGVGIDIPHVRYVIRVGCPPSLQLWVQEFGRAGRDGDPAEALLLFNEYPDWQRLPFWTRNNQPLEKTKKEDEFKQCWCYIYRPFVGECLRKAIGDHFGDGAQNLEVDGKCCLSCEMDNTRKCDVSRYFLLLIQAIRELQSQNGVGERKIIEWLRGNNVKWKKTPEMKSKVEASEVEGKGKVDGERNLTAELWQVIIRQAIALGYVEMHFFTNRFQRYEQTNRTLTVSVKGTDFLNAARPVNVPDPSLLDGLLKPYKEREEKKERPKKHYRLSNKHYLPGLKEMIEDTSTWIKCEEKEYLYPGFGNDPGKLLYVEDCNQLAETSKCDPHFIYNDMQLSRGPANRPTTKEWNIDGTCTKLVIHKSPCEGVKKCSGEKCSYVVSRRQHLNHCRAHPNAPLENSEFCNIIFVYVHPEDYEGDRRRWLGVLSSSPGEVTHSHDKPAANKLPSMLEEKITECVQNDFTKTAKDIQLGYGMPCMPADVSPVAANIDVISRVVKKARVDANLVKDYTVIQNFQSLVQSRVNKNFTAGNFAVTCNDASAQSNCTEEVDTYLSPYKVDHYLTDQLNAVFFVSRLMAKILSGADFIVADVTFPPVASFPYLLNLVAYNHLTMEYMVCGRANMDRVTAEAYQIAFTGIFKWVNHYFPQFDPKESLQAVIVDYSDAQVQGLVKTVGKTKAFSILKGCQVHWMRSVLRVASRVCNTDEEYVVFKLIGKAIPLAETEDDILKMFDVLCGKVNVAELDGIVLFDDLSVTSIVNAHWNRAENWCNWWTQERHLKLLCEATTDMSGTLWETTPFTTNAVESKNRLSVPVSKGPSTLITQLEHQYRVDRLATQKHVAAEHDITIHQRSDTQEAMARRAVAKATWRRRNSSKPSDKSGPPDTDEIQEAEDTPVGGKRRNRYQNSDSRKKSKNDLLGKLVSVECQEDDGSPLGWFDAKIESHHKGLGYLLRFMRMKTLSFCK